MEQPQQPDDERRTDDDPQRDAEAERRARVEEALDELAPRWRELLRRLAEH